MSHPDKNDRGLKKPEQEQDHGEVGEALEETFPASDPPAFTPDEDNDGKPRKDVENAG